MSDQSVYMSQSKNSVFQNLMVVNLPERETSSANHVTKMAKMAKEVIGKKFPFLSVKNTCWLFPGVVIPITVGRQRFYPLVKKAQKGNKLMGYVRRSMQIMMIQAVEDIYQVVHCQNHQNESFC